MANTEAYFGPIPCSLLSLCSGKVVFLLPQTVGIYMCKESAVVVFDGHWHWEYGENHSRLILEICSAILPEDLRYLVQSASYYMKTKPRSVLLAPRDVNSKY